MLLYTGSRVSATPCRGASRQPVAADSYTNRVRHRYWRRNAFLDFRASEIHAEGSVLSFYLLFTWY